jgi:hypothetical protein
MLVAVFMVAGDMAAEATGNSPAVLHRNLRNWRWTYDYEYES